MKKINLPILLFIVAILSGCATRQEIKTFQSQMDHLVSKNAKQSQQLERLDSLFVEMILIQRQNQANYDSDLAQSQQQMRTIESILRESGLKVNRLTQQIEKMEDNISDRIESQTMSEDTSIENVSVNARQIFETAQLDFNRGKFDLARISFEQFLSLFPNSILADDAQYYLAECLYNLGKYSLARREYLNLIDKNPDSEFVPAALYKAGMASMKMDDLKNAKKYFEKLVKNHPQSLEVPLGKEKLKELKSW
jgi:tol-pal system protein YbgF